MNEAGRTVVPMRIFTKNGRLKLEIAVVRGKKKYEKKQILKERSVDREIRRDIKNY
ncbi:MAG: SsrA-binding protein [Candidatus Peregrinibacteria bacterium]|nr:SsrA-binding protein [Candidatus Peregrinibacteria bacterium]